MSEIWVLGIGAAIAGLVQGISGFAFAMAAMSIWVWGVDPALAAVMAVFGGWTGQLISAIRVRRGWHLELLWSFLLGSAVGIPIGTRLLPLLDPIRFKLVLGSMLVICCSAMLATSRLPKIEKGGRLADAGVGLLGGVGVRFVLMLARVQAGERVEQEGERGRREEEQQQRRSGGGRADPQAGVEPVLRDQPAQQREEGE